MGHGRPLALRCCLRGSGSHEDPSIPSEFWESKDLLLVGPGPAGLAVLPDPRCSPPATCLPTEGQLGPGRWGWTGRQR